MGSPGIIFTATDVRLRDQFGNPVMCTLCGGTLFDVTIRDDQPDRVECSNFECGQPATPRPADPREATA